MNANLQRIPDDLKELDQWVLWRYVRGSKVPFQTSSRCASSTDPKTWCSYEAAEAAVLKYPDYWCGLGFVFAPEDPFAGVDLDDCIDQNGIKGWAFPILERFADTYMEVSPSGKGIKIWCKARIEHAIKTTLEDGGLEVYDRARYFTVTGRTFRGDALGIEEHQADIEWLMSWGRGTAGGGARVPQRIGARILHGERHFTLVSVGGTLARRGITSGELAALFLEMRKRFEGPPVPDGNLISLADDLVRRYGHGQ